jgi:Kef-type K+ transport system membrane component KefB
MTSAELLLLGDLGVILFSATAVVLFGRMVRLPSIVSYLLAGLVLGPGLGVIPESEAIDVIAEAGIVLLLFLVGLELSVEKITKVGRVAVGAGLARMALTGLVIAGISWFFGLEPLAVLFVAVALTFSSTVVAVKLLDQMGTLDERHGRIAVGMLLVEDITVLVVLTTVAGIGRTGGVDAAGLALELARAFGGMLLLVGAAAAAASLLPWVYSRAAASPEAILIWSLAWCFSMVYGSNALGLAPELGAFIAGVSLADLPHCQDLRRRVHPLMDFFIAVFFVTLGIHLELDAALAVWPLVLVLSVFTLVLKPVISAWMVRSFGERPETSVRAGIVLAQTSEFSFVLGALVIQQGLASEEILSIVAAVGVVTMGLSSLVILHQDRIIAWVERVGAYPILRGAPESVAGRSSAGPGRRPVAGHVIVVGMNSLGRAIVESLQRSGERALAVDTDLRKLEGLPCDTVLGSAEYLSVLHEAGISGAKLLVSALRIEDVNRLLAYRAATFGVPAVIHVYDQVSESEFSSMGVAHVLDSRAAGIRKITEALREEGVFVA